MWKQIMPDLPSGTVTFLFTDIEGSTALWERDRAAMREAVARQLAILQSLITAHHGVLYKTVGDGTQAAFASAEDALQAALASQRALLAEAWGEPLGPLRVRMGLHAGEAIPDARGDYLAAPLNRLSRLLSTGHGGQILLAQTVQQLTRGALPAGSDLRDLGEHRLRDLLEPEQVYQLVHPDLPTEFPPLKSLEHRPNNLPLQPTPFLGREREVGAIVALLGRADVRLLTLTGPGGTGKTRLALQAAAELLDDFADGVFFVPLAGLSDPALVPHAIAGALRVHEQSSQPLVEQLKDVLAVKQVLLVLDNVEHLVAAAPIVGDLLGAATGLKVLVTSRVPLRLRAEREYPVPPLGLPRRKPPPTLEQLSQFEAVRLFIDRAQAVKPGFAVDNVNAPAIAEICHRLDGLPLAIELAAARIRMLSPQAMLTRLEQRLPLLTSGARDAPQRQRTLRNTIAWSYDLLEPEEQRLFRRLAVFAGGATFEAVEVVANPEGDRDVFGGLERLLEQSLLRQEDDPEGQPRFSMLETIREFGLEQLEASGEAEKSCQHHAEYLLAWVEQQLSGPGEDPAAWDRVEHEVDNLRAALAWVFAAHVVSGPRLAGALGGFWFIRGYWHEGRQWLEQALVWEGLDPERRADLAEKAGLLAHVQRDYSRAETLYAEALRHWQTVDNRAGQAYALKQLGEVAAETGDLEQGSALFDEALSLSRELNDLHMVGAMLGNQGYLARQRGDQQRAKALMEEALATFRQIGDAWGIAVELTGLGFWALAEGDTRRAAAHFMESLRWLRDRGETFRIVEALWGLGCSLADGEDPSRAARLLGVAKAMLETLGASVDPEDEPLGQRAVALLRERLGEAGLDEAFRAGRALALEDAVAEALAEANTSG
jgi:predicted ATPase/class 3 adenylate cyclase